MLKPVGCPVGKCPHLTLIVKTWDGDLKASLHLPIMALLMDQPGMTRSEQTVHAFTAQEAQGDMSSMYIQKN